MLVWFALTLFVSAALLFLLQPMFAKMLLPLLGGTPAVWNTCMLFYQAALLAGYASAHATTARLATRRQAALLVLLLCGAVLLLPIRVPAGWTPPAQRNPIPWLLLLLVVAVGLPFFMLATISPLIQKWFAYTGHASAKDPYFLYSASNLGSMLGLLAYPVAIEPHLRLAAQSRMWAGGYALLLVLALGCALMVWRSRAVASSNASPTAGLAPPGLSKAVDDAAGLTLSERLRWVALAFVPSSLMLGVTSTLTTDIPAIPLFWVIPLAIYLGTFILVFAKKSVISHAEMVGLLPLLILAAVTPLVFKSGTSVWLLIPLDLATFFVAAMVCHGELARSRPATQHLTAFYLCLAVGGVLGGALNALVAPLVFRTIVEYPLALVLAALLRPRLGAESQQPVFGLSDVGLPAALGVFTVALIRGVPASGFELGSRLQPLLMFGAPLLLCFSFARRPMRFGLGVAAILLASTFYPGQYGRVLQTERSFFGVYRIVENAEGSYRMLFHGSTVHGVQSLDELRRLEPLAYYAATGPIGQVFAAYSGSPIRRRVAVVGLGTGSLACYGTPGQQFTFYEIDPLVERIARNPRYFTYLRDCPPQKEVVLGDARLSLGHAPDHHFGVIVLDAFSSDAIPMHLLTREALQLYLAKLAPHGILAFNISNRFLDLRPVLGDLARDAGLACLVEDDLDLSEAEKQSGKFASRWVVIGGEPSDLDNLSTDRRWNPLPGRPGARVWTDDFSNLLGAIRRY